MMRIGIDARVLTLPELRGMAAYLMAILKAWPAPDDCFVLFAEKIPNSGKWAIKNRVGWQVVPSPKGSRIHVWDWWALPRAVKKSLGTLDLFWSPANLTFPLQGVPQVVTIHDTLLQEQVKFKDPVDRAYYRCWGPWSTRQYAQGVITVSRFSADRINRVFRYPGAKIHVIYNGADLAHEPVNREKTDTVLSRSGVTRSSYVYALGAESPWKNTAGVLRAFARVHRYMPEITLVISGVQERFMAQVQSQCRQLGLGQGAVSLLGYVDQVTRDSLYAGAALFVYPSLFEGFGLPPLEAMSLGTAVVASNAASIPEVTGSAALLVDASDAGLLADAMMQVLRNRELRNRLIDRGRQRVSRFQWAISARRHWEVMSELLQTSGR